MMRPFLSALALAATLTLACAPPDGGGDGGGDKPTPKLTVVVQKGGDGLGAVVSEPEGIDCDTDCEEQEHAFAIGGNVALIAEPARDALFAGWSCIIENGSIRAEPEASVVAATPEDEEGDRIVCTPEFRQLTTLLVAFSGQGAGRVTGSLLGADGVTPRIDCGRDGSGDCVAGYFTDEVDTLTGSADDGSTFVGWRLDCGSGTAPVTLAMTEDKNCEAQFD